MKNHKKWLFAAFCLICFAVNIGAESAPPSIDEITARAAVIMDAATGDILFAKNPDELIPPASLTKLMTIYAAQRLAALQGTSLDEVVPLPPESWAVNQPPRSSLMFLAQGQIVTLRELFLGLAVPSGNDAAVAVALRFAPTVEKFAAVMNGEAARMGLRQTRFVEPSGIDENNITTAAEFAAFCRTYILEYPQNLTDYHTVPEFAYPKASNVTGAQRSRPGTILQGNHISIISIYEGADGLKTGYIDEAGYNLAATAQRDGTRLIAVILGVPAELGPRYGDRARTEDARKLLDYGYENYKTLRLELPALAEAKVWKGRQNRVPVLVAPRSRAGGNAVVYSADGNVLALTISAGRGEEAYIETAYNTGVRAPFPAGAPVGTLTVYDGEGELAVIDLLAGAPVERAGLVKRFFHSIAMFLRGIK
ncbi:MAG: D-alanyl-D-alanine carboxypeptidase [Spirochaetaceae bacterium]|jgi:D-alanyl-D-alanine carboxypeptidase (penicillin-binding protein 5/6)|nr:D-alanyl-D-alanine carboxypeptidase [Spirochaetaceae bacterium]